MLRQAQLRYDHMPPYVFGRAVRCIRRPTPNGICPIHWSMHNHPRTWGSRRSLPVQSSETLDDVLVTSPLKAGPARSRKYDRGEEAARAESLAVGAPYHMSAKEPGFAFWRTIDRRGPPLEASCTNIRRTPSAPASNRRRVRPGATEGAFAVVHVFEFPSPNSRYHRPKKEQRVTGLHLGLRTA